LRIFLPKQSIFREKSPRRNNRRSDLEVAEGEIGDFTTGVVYERKAMWWLWGRKKHKGGKKIRKS